ncbi:hypothetical protein C8R43DRAFT_1242832 [Mycena crocata]|nr:hypothetical protein C8R43DRAFT_1242832 [Mycena crocata]
MSLELPNLPLELEREIFEMAAHSGDRPQSILTLMLVASRVKFWLEPILYRTVAMYGVGHQERLLACLQFKDPIFLRNSVRNLLLSGVAPKHHKWLLNTCSKVRNLFIADDVALEDFPPVSSLRLKELHCDLTFLFIGEKDIDFRHGLFAHITHLRLYDYFTSTCDQDLWSGLTLIPHLSHLAVEFCDPVPFLSRLLKTCKSLRVLLLSDFYVPEPSIFAPLANDCRFVLMLLGLEQDWQTGIQTGIDVWARAEAFIARRRSGEVPVSNSSFSSSMHQVPAFRK